MIDTFIAHFGEILPFILIGFGAQIIDGALGMAYGVISSTLLLAMASFALVASITPGPVNSLALTSGVHHGFRRSLGFVTGATLGFTALLLLAGVGMAEAVAARLAAEGETVIRFGEIIAAPEEPRVRPSGHLKV